MTWLHRRNLYFESVMAILALSRRFPAAGRHAEVRTLAAAAYLLSRRRRIATMRGLDATFGAELSRAAKTAIARAAFYQFWRDTFWMLPSQDEQRALAAAPLRGEGHLRAALARGKGVILLETNSLGSRMLPRIALHARGYAIHQVHGKRHLGGFEIDPRDHRTIPRSRGFFDACEGKFLAEIIYLPDSESLAFTRTLMERLRRNAVLALAGDGRQSQRLLALPFLCGERMFPSGPMSLARSSGATVLVMFGLAPRGGAPEVIIEPAIEVAGASREAAIEAGIRRYVALMEKYCRAYPEQYYGWRELIPPVQPDAHQNRHPDDGTAAAAP
jgi:lauroyl/myristoyl acyltransferase